MVAKLFLVIVLNFFVKQLNCNGYEIVRVSTTETPNPKDDKTIILETQLKYKEEILTKFEQISNKLVETNEKKLQKMDEKLIKIQSQTELQCQTVSTNETPNPKDDKTIILETQLKLYKEEILTKFEQISTKLDTKIGTLLEVVQTNEKNLQKMNEKLMKVQSQTELLQEKMKNIKTAVPSNPRSCKEIQTQGSNFSGIYKIKPALAVEPFDVLCDMETRGGGWTYLMSRFDGSQEFYLDWQHYKNGFGNLSGEFWLGLEHFYEITKSESMELLIELVNWEGKKRYAYYESFEIGSEKEGYSLRSLAGYNGDAGDSLIPQVGAKFTTFDKDQDDSPDYHCASHWKSAWWYKECSASDLNQTYGNIYGSCIYWATFFNDGGFCLKESRMMVRPRNKH